MLVGVAEVPSLEGRKYAVKQPDTWLKYYLCRQNFKKGGTTVISVPGGRFLYFIAYFYLSLKIWIKKGWIVVQDKLQEIKGKTLQELQMASTLEELNEIRIRFLGKKGELTTILRGMGKLSPEERPVVGQLANEIRATIEEELEKRTILCKAKARDAQLAAEVLDVTLPGIVFENNGLHPLTTVTREIEDIFLGLGFTVAEGPEIELDYYNFEALNLHKDHPARDMQDTFFFSSDVVLRTHTSPVQVRTMERTAPNLPVKVIAPGKVYRRDDDATHSPMFHQVEGLAVDERITFGDLKGILQLFAEQMFGPKTKTRFRPSFFPFTEPSAEVDISCGMCAGKGCRVCSYTGWLEILGCGMVHPKVLEMSGYDGEKVTGFAFGMGVERIALLKYNINDMRLLFENDMRFLAQF